MTTDCISKDCNEGKHFFINSKFCDGCNIDVWYTKVKEQAHKEVCEHLLLVLQSVCNEQYHANLLRLSVGEYLYQAVNTLQRQNVG